ncbi:hypothetical protein [Janthinobacterium violaceinigrum]|uniref:Uncharacterized protein n=1 Tax=Janthinobacterium violaceinigrum TaxID=2654252 RepID=A0A6I1IG39_9BURK|nr:hypothetical protein [Janthinobacterium violaceinigrum]KAB8066298.1 hypothetical protein GCN75_03655 [Janthinobacterium violaceinigrum]
MNTISTIISKPKFASTEQPVLAIDGVPVYQWVKSQIFDEDGNDDTHTLVPAQTWLYDQDESRIAWELLEPTHEGATVAPLLVCPDDMDLNCTVVVVEQIVDKKTVEWRRFGLSINHINGVVTSVRWSELEQRAIFDRTQFEKAFLDFKRLSPSY